MLKKRYIYGKNRSKIGKSSFSSLT